MEYWSKASRFGRIGPLPLGFSSQFAFPGDPNGRRLMSTGFVASVRQVPSFDVHEYRQRRSAYCLCVFVINENGKLQKQLERTWPYMNQVDVVIADGGSTDGSTDRAVLDPLGVNTL